MSSSWDVHCFFWILQTIYYLLLIILLCSPCILEMTFQPSKKLPLEFFGVSLCSALKGAKQVVEAAPATCSFCKLGLEPGCLSQCICFNVFLIDISCYNLLFINLQESVNATGEADCKLLCDNDAIKGKHYGKPIVNFMQDSYVPPKSIISLFFFQLGFHSKLWEIFLTWEPSLLHLPSLWSASEYVLVGC